MESRNGTASTLVLETMSLMVFRPAGGQIRAEIGLDVLDVRRERLEGILHTFITRVHILELGGDFIHAVRAALFEFGTWMAAIWLVQFSA